MTENKTAFTSSQRAQWERRAIFRRCLLSSMSTIPAEEVARQEIAVFYHQNYGMEIVADEQSVAFFESIINHVRELEEKIP